VIDARKTRPDSGQAVPPSQGSNLAALDASTGKKLREIQLLPVWSGPAVSRGRVYVGTENIVLPDVVFIGPTQTTGTLFSFGLPGEDEVSRMSGGKE
jgi:outer membrane protein assembly factor BamB